MSYLFHHTVRQKRKDLRHRSSRELDVAETLSERLEMSGSPHRRLPDIRLPANEQQTSFLDLPLAIARTLSSGNRRARMR